MVEPIGEQWMQTAMLSRQIAFNTFAKVGEKAPDLEDFMPARYKRMPAVVVEQVDPDQNKRQFDAFLGIFGFKDVNNGRND